MIETWKSRRVTVMGLGLQGGGVGAVQFFAKRGAKVLVTDTRTEKELAESVELVKGPDVTFVLGRHRKSDFTGTDLIVANPAVHPESEYLEAARQAGIPIETELGLFMKLCPAPTVGITGSNGKSTTAALTAKILEAAGMSCRLAGNIGKSLLPEVETIGPGDVIVLEISSFQLEYLNLWKLSPHVAVVTNLQVNHLNWHKTMPNYAAAKRHIIEHQKPGDAAVLNWDDEWVRPMAEAAGGSVLYFSGRSPMKQGAWLDGESVRWAVGGRSGAVKGLERMKLPGLHNRQNVCAATAAATFLGVESEVIEKVAIEFETLPHRLERVAVKRGVTYINDSIGTNPDSVAAALNCFDGNVILIAGGESKDLPWKPMIAPVIEKVKLMLLIGRAADELERVVRAADAARPEIVHAKTLERAMEIAHERAVAGDVVLLSPACASFDQFRNFAERGEAFARVAQSFPE